MKTKLQLFLFFFSIQCIGQIAYDYKDGYEFILKAERNFKGGNIAKAEQFVEKAKKSNYGFCGNAWASAYGRINLLEARILNRKREFDKALAVLDSLNGCNIGADCNARDSLKIATLILKFGKEKVKESFENTTVEDMTVKELDFERSYSLNLKGLNYIFRFVCSDYKYVFDGEKSHSENKTKSDILSEVKNYNYFKQLE